MSQPTSARSFAILAATCALLTGCVIESPLAVRRFWADYNTLNAPAAYFEKTSRVPMDSARVRELRWQYNLGPDSDGIIARRKVAAGTNAGAMPVAVPPTGSFSPLPPDAGKMETPAPVADKPPDAGRTAESRDAWRFVH